LQTQSLADTSDCRPTYSHIATCLATVETTLKLYIHESTTKMYENSRKLAWHLVLLFTVQKELARLGPEALYSLKL